MKKTINITLTIFFLVTACTSEETSIQDTTDNPSSNEEEVTQEISISEDVKTSSQEEIDNIIQEFPDGLVSFLSKQEKDCLFENANSFVIRQMEVDLMEGRKITKENLDYFTICNIPPPPEPTGMNESAQGKPGVSPPLDDKGPVNQTGMNQSTSLSSIHLSYLGSIRSMEDGLGNIADPSIVETSDGNIRVYFKNGNEPQANINGYDNLVHSAISTDGGRTWKVENSYLGLGVGNVRRFFSKI